MFPITLGPLELNRGQPWSRAENRGPTRIDNPTQKIWRALPEAPSLHSTADEHATRKLLPGPYHDSMTIMHQAGLNAAVKLQLAESPS